MLDEATRVKLGAQAGTAPDVLRGLAEDASVTVRAALALNPIAPPEADALLARDPDERVRTLLAQKLAALAPSLSAGAQGRLQRETLETLTALAGDEAVRVRAAIAEAVKDLPDAPKALILRLARDHAVMVCEPIIRFSPMLTTEDLVGLVAAAPSAGTRLAVARRPSIAAEVGDALVESGSEEVITALLANGSAQIRESVLDALAERAADHVAWRDPLTRRPTLSPVAVKTLSCIVANHLLEVLAARADIEPEVAQELRTKLAGVVVVRAVAAVETGGKPQEDEVLEAARQGDVPKAAKLLAAAAGVALPVVRRAATLRSAKGLVSLAWQAGFTMKAGVALQVLLARLSPGATLKPGPGNSFPLSMQEMRWQIEFLSRDGR